MTIPTPDEIREWSQVDFASLGYDTDEQMQLLIDRAVAFFELVTGREMDTIETALEPMAAEAIQRWVEHTAYRSQADIIETAADFDLIVSFSVTGYSENRRAAEDARKAQMLHPWPLLHDLLWNLTTPDKRDEWLDTWNIQNAPAFAVTEVDWRNSDNAALDPRPGTYTRPLDEAMALGSAMVDRAVIVRKQADARKVEGTTVFSTSESPPIRARLTLNQPGERREDGRVFTEPTPTLLLLVTDTEGHPVEVKASDKIRVASEALGTHLYEVSGDVQPGRKRRRVICWTATLKLLDEQDAAGL